MKVSGISAPFGALSRSSGQVPHVLLTRSPLGLPQYCYWLDLVRLACVRHAASVRPEPGSNSPSRADIFRCQTRLQNGQLSTSLLSVNAIDLVNGHSKLRPPALAFFVRYSVVKVRRSPEGGAAGTRSRGRLVPLVPSLASQHKAEGLQRRTATLQTWPHNVNPLKPAEPGVAGVFRPVTAASGPR